MLLPDANIRITRGAEPGDRLLSITPAADQTGVATVTLTVEDAQGMDLSQAFTVSVYLVNDAPTFIIDKLQGLVDADGLDRKDADKLIKKLAKAHADFARGKNDKGIKEVEKFKDEVEKLVKKGKLPAAAAQECRDAADQVIASAGAAAGATALPQSRQSIIDDGVLLEDGRVDADNIPAGGAGDTRLVDWSLKPEDCHPIKIHPGSRWVKPFVCDFKPDDPNKDIKIELSDLVE